MVFNFSHYLNTLMPVKRMSLTREKFLEEIYNPIIEKYDLKDKKGDHYMITRELTSNLFTGKCNLPQVLVKGFKEADSIKEQFCEKFKLTLDKIHSKESLEKITEQLKTEILKYRPFPKETTKKMSGFFVDGDIYELHWFLFKVLGEMENRGVGQSFRKQGRPKKNPNRVEFFYLSEEEKHKEFNKMVKAYSKENANISYNDFRYFLDSLAYVPDNVSKEEKEIILFNFFSSIENDDPYPRLMDMLDYFQNTKRTLGSNEIYDSWLKLIPDVGIKYEFKKLKDLFKQFVKTGNTQPLLYEFHIHVDNDVVLKEKQFRIYFKRNGFLLPPNMFGTINRDIWYYCFRMANIAANANMVEEFTQYINKLRSENENTKTVNDRCDELIFQCNRFASNHL